MTRKWLLDPFIHFILIGSLLFGLYAFTVKPDLQATRYTIDVSTYEIQQLLRQWQRENGTQANEKITKALVDGLIHQEIMFREALRIGLGENDTIVRRRLIQKMEFLSANKSQLDKVDDVGLLDYYLAHQDEYIVEEKRSFSHIYFSKQYRGDSANSDAVQALVSLSNLAGKSIPLNLGDDFILQSTYQQINQTDAAQIFGVAFAKKLFEIRLNQWQGPVDSQYGVHLIHINKLMPATTLNFEQAKKRVHNDWLNQKLDSHKTLRFERLRARYKVNIEQSDVKSL